MACTVRDAAIVTRSGRCTPCARDQALAHARTGFASRVPPPRASGGTWIARRRDENGSYHEEKLALAYDVQDADAHNILDFGADLLCLVDRARPAMTVDARFF
jgi:hypothetical protein